MFKTKLKIKVKKIECEQTKLGESKNEPFLNLESGWKEQMQTSLTGSIFFCSINAI